MGNEYDDETLEQIANEAYDKLLENIKPDLQNTDEQGEDE